MIPHSRSIAAVALLLAAATHAGIAVLQDDTAVEMAGGPTALAAAGNSFSNLVEGVQTPDVAQPVEQASLQPPQKEPVQPPLQKPTQAPAVSVVRPVPAALSDAPGIAPAAQVVAAAAPPETPDVVKPEQSMQKSASQPAPPQAVEPELQKTEPEPAPETPARSAKPQGNSTANAVRGTADGAAKAPGGEASKVTGVAKEQGNAAADNYRGQVLRRVQRAKRKSSSIRGQVVVVFSIAPGGALSAARIGRSSGHAKLDAIALAQIRRAGPFPPPPPGAQTTYKVTIRGM